MFKLVIVVASLSNPNWNQRFEVSFETQLACELTREAPGVWWGRPHVGKLIMHKCEAHI